MRGDPKAGADVKASIRPAKRIRLLVTVGAKKISHSLVNYLLSTD